MDRHQSLITPIGLSSPLTSLLSVGIGYASIVIVSLLNIYYIVILGWGVYYLFQVGVGSPSFISLVPSNSYYHTTFQTV